MRIHLTEIGHQQQLIPEVTDRLARDNFLNEKIRQLRSYPIYTIFYWVQEIVR